MPTKNRFSLLLLVISVALPFGERTNVTAGEADAKPLFTRHVQAVFSRLGCNSGTCHGAVKGKNGFKLSLFGADPALDYERLLHEGGGRRLDPFDPDASLLLLKATGQASHGGGQRTTFASAEYQILRRWIAAGASLDAPERSRLRQLRVYPVERTAKLGETYRLRVEAVFSDGSVEDVTQLCSYESRDSSVATVELDGQVTACGVGDAALVVRYRSEPALSMLLVPRSATPTDANIRPNNFIDHYILAKLRRLNIPPSVLAGDAVFLRRASLDVTGQLPAPAEVRAFLADKSVDKRDRKIEELLHRPGYAALWTLKFCDLLKAGDFGVYADGIRKEVDAPRFQQWVRTRLEENIPYDQFVERILTATSRDGRDVDAWAKEVLEMEEGYGPGRSDVETYRRRRTLDLYWQRNSSSGLAVTLQIAHAFLGLRLECAQCHRHPHDVWQQDDLLSFANFFMPVRKIGFQGQNEKKFPESAAVFKRMNEEAKKLDEQIKKLRGGEFKKLQATVGGAKKDAERIGRELAKLEKEAKPNAEQVRQRRQQLEKQQAVIAAFEKMKKQLADMQHRSQALSATAKRVLHSEVRLLETGTIFASVSSPIGTQTSKQYRLLGQSAESTPAKGQDPRQIVMAWLRRPDNPYFAKAIVNRVWAHYFGRGIVDPPDDLSPLNPPSHPELLQQLCRGFIEHNYNLKWLHLVILRSRTYQQSSHAAAAAGDRRNYASFLYRRLPAEVMLDALNQATATTEKMDMDYFYWPAAMRTVEVPFTPRNQFVAFMLANFGKPKRNAAVQCDCERDDHASVLQVLSFANHPRVWAKIRDDKGRVAVVLRDFADDQQRIEELFLATLSRLPNHSERQACRVYLRQAPSPTKGLQGILWSLLNTREFVLQH